MACSLWPSFGYGGWCVGIGDAEFSTGVTNTWEKWGKLIVAQWP